MKIGLGSWRFFLAFLVAISHLYKDMIHGPAAYAVWAFFVLSGYLMTYVLNKKYQFTFNGLKNYAYNRFLRIYPAYLVSLLLGVITILILTSIDIEPSKLNPQFVIPNGFWQWVVNFTMFIFVPQPSLLVPVAGALFVEVWAYALMPLLAMSRSATIIAIILALFTNIQYGFDSSTFITRYTGFVTGFFAFSFGALIFHFKDFLSQFNAPKSSILVWIIHTLYWLFNPSWPWTYGILLSVPLSAWVTLSLSDSPGNNFDKWLGDLSYPVYLLHTTIASWFLFFFGYDRDIKFFLLSFLMTLFLSFLMFIFIEKPLQKKKKI